MDLRGVNEFFKDTFKYIIVIILTMIVFLYVISFQQIYESSMSPTLKDGDVTVLSKINYKLFKLNH